MRKGQVEIIVILGVIIVAIVAILYASQGPSQPRPPATEQELVKRSLTNLITSAADEALRTLSLYGGYESPQTDGVAFLGGSVTYWQREGHIRVPNTRQTFISLVQNFINRNKDSFVAGLGKDVTVGIASVTANFLPSKISLSVTLPATLNQNPLPSTYDVQIPTKFSEILEFSEQFSAGQQRERYLEYFILASMLASPIEDDIHSTPFFIALTNCGEFVFKSWNDIKENVQDRVSVTLAHSYMPGKSPRNVGDITPFPKYIIPPLNGKSYGDLDVSFHLPDNFELSASSFQFVPNPIFAIATPVAFTSVCTSDPVYVNYSLNFPVIVRIRDPLTENVFQFANQLFIKGNKPGNWADPSIYQQQVQERICSDRQCPANLRLRRVNGQPLPDADVTFMGCSLGKTDGNGALQSGAPCGAGPLEIIREGYTHYSQPSSFSQLASLDIILTRILNPTIHLYEVIIQNNTLLGEYQVTAINPLEEKKAMFTLTSTTNPQLTPIIRLFDQFSGTLTYIPEDIYVFSARLVSENLQVLHGAFQNIAILSEATPELYIYLPDNYEMRSMTDQDQIARAAATFGLVLARCNIGPISQTPVPESAVPCVKKYNEV